MVIIQSDLNRPSQNFREAKIQKKYLRNPEGEQSERQF